MSLLCVAGLGRLPQITLPYAKVDECPVGISLLAGRGNDEMLLAIARELG
jgi:amidase